ncbi:MAG: DUF2188 domain-containing protein [Bifidobacteriaceae bacterium]|jgi:hypothetical protein|nr:DUF2188 domain-containing protein [Bifidobacteriaceae bacterium]
MAVNRRNVEHRGDGRWQVIEPGASRPGAVLRTQREAIERGREILGNSGGGELGIRGLDGTFRAQDTIKPGNDPRPSKG